jgi:hypothetical protein
MVKPLALIIQANEGSLASISKLVESRDCSVHFSRTVDDVSVY